MPGSVGRSTGLDVSPSNESVTGEVGPTVARAAPQEAQVSAWTVADQLPQRAQQSGGLPASSLAGGLTSSVALKELDSLLTSVLPANLGVTEDDARAAVGLISSLPQAQQREVLEALGKTAGWVRWSTTSRGMRALRWSSAPGIERAAKEVSNRISDFRGELHAGGFSLGLEVTAKATAGKTVTLGGSSSFDVTEDGRLLNQKGQVKEEVSVGAGFVEGSATFDSAGHLKQVKASVVGAGVELDKQGKVTLSYKEGPATVSTFVDGNAAKYGASLGLDHSTKFLGVKVSVGAKATVTAQGIAREYYPDIGGKQEGIFGPMPELEQGAAWASLPRDRQQWYARQGFTEKMWPTTT